MSERRVREYFLVRDARGEDSYEWNGLDEARVEARECDEDYPLSAPHRVIKVTVIEEEVPHVSE